MIRKTYLVCLIHPNPNDMNKERITWSLLLRQSNFLQHKGRLYPEVLLRGNLSMEDIVKLIVAEGSEFREEALISAAHQIERTIQKYLVRGYAVNGLLGTLTPAVTGEWDFNRTDPEARAKTRATFRYTLSKEMKEYTSDPFFLEKGMRASRLTIYSLVNRQHPEANWVASPGDYLMLTGEMLLMNGDDPSRGLYFVDAETLDTVAFIPPEEIRFNKRKTMFILVPADLPPGAYYLKVISQCTTSSRPLKTPASFLWEHKIEVMPPDEALAAIAARQAEGK